jgi:biotin operon repressor
MSLNPSPDLLTFFKALADENRLKIVGLLAGESYSGEALAELLGLKPATVSHHLARLAEAGLVDSAMQGHSKLYRLRLDALHQMANELLAEETLPRVAAAAEGEAYDRKVLRDFLLPDGTLKEIPAQQKKLKVVLRHLVNAFEPGREYSEKEVNASLGRAHADTASLRRAMISYKLMARGGGRYWRVESAGT